MSTDRCTCRCHTGASVVPEPAPLTTDPIAAVTACSRCAVWHEPPPTVRERPPASDDGAVWPLDYE